MSDDLHEKYRDSLRGDQDVILTYIMKSPEFTLIQNKYLSDGFTGIYSLLGRVSDEDELGRQILDCAEELSDTLKISKQNAIKLILRPQASAIYGARYTPKIEQDGDDIIIRIGQKTTVEDIRNEWHIVTGIQEKLGGKSRKQSANPELYYCIYRQRVLGGRKMQDIFNDYREQRLDGYEHLPTIDDEHEFRKRYNKVTKGL